MQTVLFICSGNTCRSPMAEAVARHVAAQGDLGGDVFFASAGVHASDGLPISPETLHALASRGIEHEGRSKSLSADMIRRADLIVAMTREHVAAALSLLPAEEQEELLDRIVMLDPKEDIPDPIGSGQAAYDALLEHLQELLPQRLEELLARSGRAR